MLTLGAQHLDDDELIAIIIRTGVAGTTVEELSKRLLARFGSLSGMYNQPFEKFLEFKGLSEVKILQITAALEIARRISEKAGRGDG